MTENGAARQGKETRDEDKTGKETRGQKEKRGTGKERREKRWREEELANLCSSLPHNEQERRGEKEGGGKKSELSFRCTHLRSKILGY